MIKTLGVIYPSKKAKNKSSCGLFECPYCATHFVSNINNIKNGNTKSCGCMHFVKKHQYVGTRLYNIWKNINRRCHTPKNTHYKEYGGRGISVCDKWRKSSGTFCEWAIKNGYNDSLEIDRKDNNGNYEPSNCQFVTRSINTQNTRLIGRRNTSGYRCVYYSKSCKNNHWESKLGHKGKTYNLGYYLTPELAAKAYNDFVIANKTAHPLNIISATSDP